MVPYIICFILTAIFALINEYTLKKNKKLLLVITAILVVLLPAFLAGVRSYAVGTDVNIYIKPSFDLATNFNSLKSWVETFGNTAYITGNFGKGFLFLLYFSSRISNNAHVFLFLIAFIIGLFVYLSLYKLRNYCSIFMGELVYLLTDYNASYNMARQSIAMAICLFAFSILISSTKLKYLKFFIWVIIAIQFHSTAVIAFVFLCLYFIFKNDNKSFSIKQMILLILVIGISIFFVPIMQYLSNIGLLDSHYLMYVDGIGNETISTAYATFTFFVICIFIYSISYIVLIIRKNSLGSQKRLFLLIAVMDITFMILSNTSFYLYRIAAYFLFIRIISLSYKSLYKNEYTYTKNSLANSYFLCFSTIFLLVLYFTFFILILNWHHTVPYIFMNN